MRLKATTLGKRLAQHPYDQAEILTAGVRVSGQRHEYLIPFNQLLAIHCKHGLVWGELEFVLADEQVVRLHGTEWQETQHFWQQLSALWQRWSQQMSEVAAGVLNEQLARLQQACQGEQWLCQQQISVLCQQIRDAFQALPLPAARLREFEHCRISWQRCNHWLEHADACRQQNNLTWVARIRQQQGDFFNHLAPGPLDSAQISAVLSDDHVVLVTAAAGGGKSTSLLARACWLLHSQHATAEQILLLTASPANAQQLHQRISQCLPPDSVSTNTFPDLAMYIIEHSRQKTPKISPLEHNPQARYALLIQAWQQQCASKKTIARAWRQWLQTAQPHPLADTDFWQDPHLIHWLAPRLDHWLSLLRMQTVKQKQLIDNIAEPLRPPFGKALTLLTPLQKAWKAALKEHNSTDHTSLFHQAVALLGKGRFISPWKYILLDDLQNLSPPHLTLLLALHRQNPHSRLFITSNDEQPGGSSHISSATVSLSDFFPFNPPSCQQHDDQSTELSRQFPPCDLHPLEANYRLPPRTLAIARHILQGSALLAQKPPRVPPGEKKALQLLAENQLAALLDKISGFAEPQQRILLLAVDHHLRPALLDIASTRWPTLHLEFMTLPESPGQHTDYCIVCGLNSGTDGLPADPPDSIIEQALAPADPHRPRQLLYIALTRARLRTWLLYNPQQPSPFITELNQLGVPTMKKP